ncbi:MAG TPA: type II toxin-antitoxin system VapC family toxin [Methylomirabilota bacterium]|jgi:predicted nucleic acid-binding protein|nr:type II toxin-antitoxin system VapC family toxin [Methylomirabilota bacterium]
MPAAWAYVDASALVKRYVGESGSSRVVSLFRRHRFLSSAIVPLEILSALSRRRLSGEFGDRDFQAAIARMTVDRARWELIGLTSLDAVHVASALAFHEETGSRLRFVTAAPRQRAAAQRCGLPVVWVG